MALGKAGVCAAGRAWVGRGDFALKCARCVDEAVGNGFVVT